MVRNGTERKERRAVLAAHQARTAPPFRGAFRKERRLAHLGTYAEAARIAPVSRQTFRMWLQRGWIRAVRVGGKTLYDLDSVAEMCRPVGKLSDEERAAIAELVAGSPDRPACTHAGSGTGGKEAHAGRILPRHRAGWNRASNARLPTGGRTPWTA
jgi:excisionase family DNA binding protein